MTSTCPSKRGRHLACVLCRDRKVKCDGGKPACEKCIRAGEQCIYAVSSKASRTELQETILQLNERIEQTEARQAAFMAHQHKRPNCTCRCPPMTETQLLDPFTTFGQHHAESRSSSPSVNNVISVGFSPLPDSDSLHNHAGSSMFPLDIRANHFFPSSSSRHAGAIATSTGLSREMIPSPAVTDQSTPQLDVSPFSDADTCPASSANTVPGSFQATSAGLPSLHDVQECTWHTSSLPEYGTMSMDTTSGDGAERLLHQFVCLNSAAEAAQYKIIGVAETAAMYASYFHKLCMEGKQNPQSLLKFLDSLQSRMSEIRDIASQQVLGQAVKSREAVGQDGAYRDRMKQFEEEHRRCAHLSLDFFRARYDFGRSLTEQS